MTRRTAAALGVAAVLVLVSGSAPESAPRVSPEPAATALVYARAAGSYSGADGSIFVARPDGTRPVRVARGRSPVLSPDGRSVAYVVQAVDGISAELRVVPLTGGAPRLAHAVAVWLWEIRWSPDSRWVVTVGEDGVMAYSAVGGPARSLAEAAASASVSPDGDELVYAVADETGSDLYVVSLAGGPARRLTHDHRSHSPVWGPSAIAFARGFGDEGDVWLVAPDGAGGATRLTATRAGIEPAAWSADGRRLLAANPARHNGRLWAVDARTGEARPLTDWRGDLFPQGLSRDGGTVLAAIGCGGTVGSGGRVIAIPFDGGPERILAEGPTGPCRASWNA